MSGFYYIKIANGLLEPKHCQAMGEAVWLYMWLQDKCTSINENGEGKVLGNKPIRFEEDVQAVLGVSRFTYMRWMKKLEQHNYIKTMRTPRGIVVVITKAKKYVQPVKNSDVAQSHITEPKPKSDVADSHSDVADSHSDVAKPHIQYKTTQDYTKTTIKNNVDPDKPAPRKTDNKKLFYELVQKLGFSDKVLLTDGRKRKLQVRLKHFTPEQLLTAAEHIGGDDYLQGDNAGGKRWGNIDYLLRSDENVDRWLTVEHKSNFKADW